jgi:hypothetical protein
MRPEFLSRSDDQNMQIVSAPYRRKSPVLKAGFVRDEPESYTKGGGFRVKKLVDNSYTRDYSNYVFGVTLIL